MRRVFQGDFMKFKNTVTGKVIESNSKLGGAWVPVKPPKPKKEKKADE